MKELSIEEKVSREIIPYVERLEKQSEQKTVDKIAKEVCKDKTSAVAFLKSTGIMNEKGELAEQYRQDKQNPNDNVEPKFHEGDKIKLAKEPKYPEREIIAIKNGAYYFDKLVHLPFSRQDEWELVEQKPADEVEPKFKVGDWIANDYCAGKIIALTDDAYLLDSEQGIPFSCEHNAHLWTIEDAQDGEVLYDGNNACIFRKTMEDDDCIWIDTYCGINTDNEFKVNNEDECWCLSEDCSPATKEQRDLLFQKMRESGYEWDDIKKELKTKYTRELDNSYSHVIFPFMAKVKSTGAIVKIHGGQLSQGGKEWIKYQSDVKDGYKVYEANDLELVCKIK